jgi:Cu/Zn superoxide dismutase
MRWTTRECLEAQSSRLNTLSPRSLLVTIAEVETVKEEVIATEETEENQDATTAEETTDEEEGHHRATSASSASKQVIGKHGFHLDEGGTAEAEGRMDDCRRVQFTVSVSKLWKLTPFYSWPLWWL